jgi:hypothetical protein
MRADDTSEFIGDTRHLRHFPDGVHTDDVRARQDAP